MQNRKRMILVVLDGWGYRQETKYNPIAEARTPFFDTLMKDYPHSLLEASGSAVGLPDNEMGNSEVGHLTIGAGRILENDVVRISHALKSGNFEENAAIKNLCEHVKKHDSVLHIQGLLSPGGVHSHEEHLFDILKMIRKIGLQKVVIHVFTDGRDTAPQSAIHSLQKLESLIEELGIGQIATASGRYYAMDRDHNWDRVEKVERAIFSGEGEKVQGMKASEYIKTLYAKDVWDEHIEPIVFLDETGKNFSIEKNDAILFFNFRSDRARMISRKIMDRAKLHNLCFASLTEYDSTLECLVAFPPLVPDTTLAAELAKAGLRQAHIAETEKYAHATYFLNGKKEMPHDGEEHILIESHRDVATHNLAPEMRAKEIVDAAIQKINEGMDFLFINFAGADMVGHTADYDATIKAIETIDGQLQRLVEKASSEEVYVMISADHGNAEMLFDEDGGFKHTAHTNNPVPCIFTDKNFVLSSGSLVDIAPTILAWYHLPIPNSMTGKNLLQKK